MQFKDVIGHETLKSRLIASVRSGRIPHAQLFAGPEEAGTLPLALAYAQYLQCQNRTETDSCGRCPACLQMAGYMHPEVHFVFPVIKERSDKAALSDDRLSVWREAMLANSYIELDQTLYAAAAVRDCIRLNPYKADYYVVFERLLGGYGNMSPEDKQIYEDGYILTGDPRLKIN